MSPQIATASPARILLVDTDSMTCELLQLRLDTEGFKSDIVNDGRRALQLDLSQYALILVDLMESDFNGLRFTSEVKSHPETYNIPVIILSKRASEDDIVSGLDAGADDYIAKPFSSRELMARIKSVIRRKRMMTMRRPVAPVVKYQGLSLDMATGTAAIDGQKLLLTRTEYLILALFLRNQNRFFERFEIIHEAWEDESGVNDRAVDTNISRLRKKLGDYGTHIINRQGFGYGFIP